MQSFALVSKDKVFHLSFPNYYTCIMLKLFTLCIAMLISLSTYAQTFIGKVISVADGDTIEMLVDGKKVRIRLFGIDSPERGQAFGTKAKEFTSSQCFGKVVRAVVQSKDRYGRYVAEVYLSNKESLNVRIVQAGFAWHYKHYSNSPLLAKAEAQARLKRKGLWKDAQPVPPWEWRKKKPARA
jgi:micrococcal nuclease